MSEVIEHFMWGYQSHYRIHLEVAARSALQTIDERFSPEVLLVGVLDEERSDRYPACVDPERECWIESDAFNDTLLIAAGVREKYVEGKLYHSHPLAQARETEALYRRSVRDAILKTIEHHNARPQNLSFFASWPETVDGYLVCAVLAVQTDILNSYHRLTSDAINLHEYRQVFVARSLIDAMIAELLADAADGLSRPDPGLRLAGRGCDEIIRSASRRLVTDTAFRLDPQAMHGVYDFYDACEEISSMKYERAEGRGRMVLASGDQCALRSLVTFSDTVRLADYRRARKLLELASDGYALHTDSHRIFGLVDVGTLDADDENLFEVEFLAHHHWEFKHAGRLLVGIRFGRPYLTRRTGYEFKLQRDLRRFFPDIADDATETLVALVRQAEQERHGTLLVISGEAGKEADRLRNQSTLTEECLLTPQLLSHLTGIDGAVLVDSRAHCYAIGVILDGLATSQGNAARGARYNSALRYVETSWERKIPTLAVVISEDGGVDFIPDPPPQIKRADLVSIIDEMVAISESSDIPRRRYNDIHDWLREHHFYMLAEDCQRANAAVEKVEKRFREENPMGVHIVREAFEADSRMDPAFYYEPE